MEIQNPLPIGRTPEVKFNSVPGKRLLYIDNIRWLMIVFVVIIHLNCTYGNVGRWYYQETGPSDIFSVVLFSMFGSMTQSYFMGFLFFIAGFFVPGSCDKKGCGRFIGERLIRLGIPTLVYMLFLHPLTMAIIFANRLSLDILSWYRQYLFSLEFIGASGPLWFALALLIFSVIYTLIRMIFPPSQPVKKGGKPTSLTHSRVIAIIAFISWVAFLIRLFQPIGTAVLNMQLCYFSQYIILFSLGIIAYRRDLLTHLPSQFGRFWFRLALYLGIPLWGLLMVFGRAATDWTPFTGGMHWQAMAYAIWESFFCIGVCLGLLVLFRDKYNTQGKLRRFFSENAFGVYVFHAPLLVYGTMLVRGMTIYPLIKMLLMTLVLLPVCFGFSYLLRRISFMKKLFS